MKTFLFISSSNADGIQIVKKKIFKNQDNLRIFLNPHPQRTTWLDSHWVSLGGFSEIFGSSVANTQKKKKKKNAKGSSFLPFLHSSCLADLTTVWKQPNLLTCKAIFLNESCNTAGYQPSNNHEWQSDQCHHSQLRWAHVQTSRSPRLRTDPLFLSIPGW